MSAELKGLSVCVHLRVQRGAIMNSLVDACAHMLVLSLFAFLAFIIQMLISCRHDTTSNNDHVSMECRDLQLVEKSNT